LELFFRIAVNTNSPTTIETELLRAMPQDKVQGVIHRQPIRRRGTSADVANVIDFFLWAESDFITGQVIDFGGF
jgi:3-oxoacyl-[acyl-carrier protein] reductase